MLAKVVVFSKEMASELLAKNTPENRKINRHRILLYKKSMNEGKWINGTSLVVGACGHLLDGQHRLASFIESALDYIEFVVIEGVEEGFLLEADRGQGRTIVQNLRVTGERYGATQVGVVNLLSAYGQSGEKKRINVGAADILERLRFMEPHITEVSKMLLGFPGGVSATAIAALTMGAMIDSEKIYPFVKQLATGEGLRTGMPVMAFRNKMLKARGTGENAAGLRHDMLASYCGIVMAEKDGREVFHPKVNFSALQRMIKLSGWNEAFAGKA